MDSENVLLINPPVFDFALYDLWMKPLGLLRLATLLRPYFNIYYIDCLDRGDPEIGGREDKFGCGKFRKMEVEKFPPISKVERPYFRYGLSLPLLEKRIQEIPSPSFTFVTSGMTYWYPGVEEVVSLVKEIYPSTFLILGGIYAQLLPAHARRRKGVDEIFTGGDFLSLVKFLQKYLKKPLSLSSSFPLPSIDLLRRKDSFVIETSKGCPFSCIYCASHLCHPGFKGRDISEVMKEIEYLVSEGVKDVALYDDAFLFRFKQHAQPLLEEIIERRLPLRFHTPNALHARYISEEVASLLKEANFHTIRIGLEVLNPQIQRETGDKVRSEDVKRAVANLKKVGFKGREIGVYILVGLPGVEKREIIEAMKFVHSLGVEVKLASLSLIPGTKLWNTLVKMGKIKPDLDPLWHNNTIFPLLLGWELGEIRQLREIAKELNEKVREDER